MDPNKDFLGVGWSYPVQTDTATGRMKMVGYEEDIKQAIQIILGTKQGERVMQPDFGSKLHEYAFESETLTTISSIKLEVEECLTRWEPRITDIAVDIEFSGAEAAGFIINLSYNVRNTNNMFNLVYPYYLTEGVGER